MNKCLTAKYYHISEFLVNEKAVNSKDCFMKQKQVSQEQLLTIHSKEYLDSLQSGVKLARVAEFPPFAFIPYFLLKWKFMNPMWYQGRCWFDFNPHSNSNFKKQYSWWHHSWW